MAEEFEESEVIFSDHDHHRYSTREEDIDGYFDYREMRDGRSENNNITDNIGKKKKKKKKKKISSSLPVNIPAHGIFRYAAADADDFEEEEEDCGGDEGEIVPPHVIIGRRIARKMAFSVCTGNGRTLKGRDLSQVRNTILRMTGFLET
ncbi:hypothetical protein SLE2022_388210 [Rubroshorea leprosula]